MRINEQQQNATVTTIIERSATVREFTLTPEDVAVQSYAPGAHIEARLPLADNAAQTRSYSLIGRPHAAHYRIAVKRLDHGRGGSLHMWQLSTGDRLVISAPQNRFALSFDAPEYLLIAGGIGVTPLLSMAQALAEHGKRTPVGLRMRYAARTPHEFVYGDTLRQTLGDALVCFDSAAGQRIDFAAEIAALHRDAQVYCCGPASMLGALQQAWTASDRPVHNLRFETFGNSGGVASAAFTVRLPRHQRELTVPANASLLETLEAAGIDVLSNCRRGECGLCALDVLAIDGTIDHRDVFLSPHEKARGERLCACISRASGTLTLDTAYR